MKEGTCEKCGDEEVELYGGLCEECDEENDRECVCTHKESNHGDMGCEVFLNEFLGDCPCEIKYKSK